MTWPSLTGVVDGGNGGLGDEERGHGVGGAGDVGRQARGRWGGAGGHDEVVQLVIARVGCIDGDREGHGRGLTGGEGAGDGEGAAGDGSDGQASWWWREGW